MVDQYASFRPKLPASSFSVTATSGGQLTSSGTLYFYIQLVNRAGRNLLSERNSVTYNAGQKIVLTIDESAIASGEEVFYILISASPDTEQNAKQLVRWQARESNQTTLRSLPISIEFSRDAHIEVASRNSLLVANIGVVADINSLPTGDDLIVGMVREVTSEQRFYIYDPDSIATSDLGQGATWHQYSQGFNTYLADTTGIGGCDRPLNQVRSALRAPPISSGDSTPVRLWWLNGYSESGASLPQGKRFNLRFSVDRSLVASNGLSYSEIFNGLVKVSCAGYVRRSTGILDTGAAQSQVIWNGYQSSLSLLLPLLPGHAAAWDIVLAFSPDQLRGYLKEGSEIEIDIVEVPDAGVPSPLHAIYGNLIINAADYLYIVPNRRKKGKALIGGYQIGTDSEQVLIGMRADTPNQRCIINGAFNGEIFIRQVGDPIYPTEAIRAYVSTESGVAKPTSPVNCSLAATGAIEVVITHPNQIRADYPDEIAELPCTVNVPYLRAFLTYNGTIYRKDDLVSVGTDSTALLISELTLWSAIATIDENEDPDFCLFAPTVTATSKTTGSLAAGNYTIQIAYEYPSPNYIFTKISHANTIPIFSIADERVKVSASDAIADFLQNKLIQGTGIAITKTTTAGREQLRIAQSPGFSAPQILNFGNVAFPRRGKVKYNSPDVTIQDDATGDRTIITIPQSSGGGNGSGTGLNTIRIDSPTAIASNTRYLVDTVTIGTFSITLPATPAFGDVIIFADDVATSPTTGFGQNPFTITPNAEHTIVGATELILNKGNQAIELTFNGIDRWTIVKATL